MAEQKKIRVIVDSTTDIPERFEDRVTVVPLTVLFGNEEYLDGINLSRDEFYRKLETGNVLPKTSQATPAAFEKVFSELHEEGCAGIVITLASALSGTYQSACIAAQDYPEIRVVDSKSVTIGAGILTEYALRCLDAGMGLDAVVEALEKKREKICLLAMLDTLEYLMRGGRLSKTAAIAGELLKIKPVIQVKDGEILVLGKARGAKKANNFLVEQIESRGVDYELPILLAYSGTSEELLDNYIDASRRLWEEQVESLDRAQVCSVIGTHAGPGAVAVAFFCN